MNVKVRQALELGSFSKLLVIGKLLLSKETFVITALARPIEDVPAEDEPAMNADAVIGPFTLSWLKVPSVYASQAMKIPMLSSRRVSRQWCLMRKAMSRKQRF